MRTNSSSESEGEIEGDKVFDFAFVNEDKLNPEKLVELLNKSE